MERDIEKEESIHSTLARSYLSYFVFSVIALFIDAFIKFDVQVEYANNLSMICFFIGTLMIVWAQYTSRHLVKGVNSTPTPYFKAGPYRFMRNPTHLGIVVLVAGYTIASGSLVFFSITMIGYLISNVFFRKYESILHDTYGEEYKNYKIKIPKIF